MRYRLVSIALALVAGFSSVSVATPISYSLVGQVFSHTDSIPPDGSILGDFAAEGIIITDGTLGFLHASNVLATEIHVTVSNSTILAPQSVLLPSLPTSFERVFATETSLEFRPDLRASSVEFTTGSTTWELFSSEFGDEVNRRILISGTGTGGTFDVARTIATVVPEPRTLSGFLFAIAMSIAKRRRRVRNLCLR